MRRGLKKGPQPDLDKGWCRVAAKSKWRIFMRLRIADDNWQTSELHIQRSNGNAIFLREATRALQCPRSRDVLQAGDLDAIRCHEIPEIWSTLAPITPEPIIADISLFSYAEADSIWFANMCLKLGSIVHTIKYTLIRLS